MMSPGNNSFASDNLAICSATDQIIMFKSAFCFTTPLTESSILPSLKCPTFETGNNGPIGAE